MSFSHEIFVKFSNRSPAMVERSLFFCYFKLTMQCYALSILFLLTIMGVLYYAADT